MNLTPINSRLTSTLSDVSFKRLLWAIVISACLHLMIVNQLGVISLLQPKNESQLIQATLVKQSVKKPEPAKQDKEKPKQALPEKKVVKPKPVAPKKPQPLPEIEPQVPVEYEPLPEISDPLPAVVKESEKYIVETIPSDDAEIELDPLEKDSKGEVVLSPTDDVPTDEEPMATMPMDADGLPFSNAQQAPPYIGVEVNYDLYVNQDKGRAGKATINFMSIPGYTYQINWTVNPTGLLSLFYDDLVQTSQGSITPYGLRPDAYTYQFGSKANKQYNARFDWQNKQVTLHSSKGDTLVPINDNTQDLLSFMFQFMYSPPLQNMQLNMTNGKKVGNYDYHFEGEEVLALNFGPVKTYHIQHGKTGSEEKTDLWLALDYQFVPVQIEKTEKDGTVIRQTATELKVRAMQDQAVDTMPVQEIQ